MLVVSMTVHDATWNVTCNASRSGTCLRATVRPLPAPRCQTRPPHRARPLAPLGRVYGPGGAATGPAARRDPAGRLRRARKQDADGGRPHAGRGARGPGARARTVGGWGGGAAPRQALQDAEKAVDSLAVLIRPLSVAVPPPPASDAPDRPLAPPAHAPARARPGRPGPHRGAGRQPGSPAGAAARRGGPGPRRRRSHVRSGSAGRGSGGRGGGRGQQGPRPRRRRRRRAAAASRWL
jgi:hypothetical protein